MTMLCEVEENFFMKLVRDKKPTAQDKKAAQDSQVAETASVASQVIKSQPTKKPVSIPIIRSSLWKILVVDDEPEVHAVTNLSVGDLEFANKKVELLSAMSGAEARKILVKEPDIAVALIDVVMETEDAGLRLVEYIRNDLNNKRIRLIIRTGQPGVAPERYVIDHYDIDDYKDKTELTTQRLYTTLRTTLKAYHDLTIIDINRQGLEKILTAAPNLYRIQPMEQFLEGVLTQITSLCPIGESSLIATINGVLAMPEDDSTVVIRTGTGKFTDHKSASQADAITHTCESLLHNKTPEVPLPKNSLLLPMELYDKILGFIYLEDVGYLTDNDRYLIQIMATQCAAALKNLKLYMNLEKSNKQNELKNQFLGMAAHDLRNPLGVIQGYAGLLRMDVSEILEANQLEYLGTIQKTSAFMQNLVNNLLDVAKIESGNLELYLEMTDLISVIEEGVSLNRLLAETKQSQLEFDYDENIPQIRIDAAKIQQVMNNLFSNAVKYSHPQTKIEVRVTKNKNALVISVKDEGQGIPEKELGKLFQAFSRTTVKGTAGETSTGLGLLICRQIVEAHRGKIWVESEIGVGSTFYVSLPIACE
jgi:signal transduction histidine kinase/CheY-like chemotaxis protein